MTDQKPRTNAERKEDTGFSETVDLHDTEFAADTWSSHYKQNGDSARRSIEYDPYSQTERYKGELEGQEMDFSERLDGVALTKENGQTASADRDDDVETAAEIAEPIRYSPRDARREPDVEENRENGASGIGMTGLGLSILSLFLLPYLMAPIGMVLGYLAYRRNSRTLGAWAMIVGAIAILGALVIYPYYTAR